QLPVKTRTAPGIRGMPSAPARTSGGSRPRMACPATDESTRQGGIPDLEGTRGIHPHRPRRGASRPAVVVAPDDRTAANVLSPPGYRIRQEGWKKATIRLTVLKASVRHADANSVEVTGAPNVWTRTNVGRSGYGALVRRRLRSLAPVHDLGSSSKASQ